jgi:sugar lactone lactonase YvrE
MDFPRLTVPEVLFLFFSSVFFFFNVWFKGICTDAQGYIYVASKGADAVLVFNAQGTQVGSVPKTDPIGVAVFGELLIVTGGVK